jgi:hypothetical protein
MSVSRYKNVDNYLNDDIDYQETFKTKFGTKGILQKETSSLIYPTEKQLSSFNYDTEVWTSSTRLTSLAFKYYGDAEYWWVIGFINKKPLDFHYLHGDIVNIPYPLESVLTAIGL